MCQYEYDRVYSHHPTLEEVVKAHYQGSRLASELTCYDHIKCYRGPSSSCLDWTEIFDGRQDCLNSDLDEKILSTIKHIR
ncbi:unnamed protein product [Adineta ricciae]|uniref:Uncharacterized protein n=1 Tax=Adineta ricciae TaxID=249248 RepID=A0A815QWY5_ADIRI|nr:unnamed protein product [Adineta ricciae]